MMPKLSVKSVFFALVALALTGQSARAGTITFTTGNANQGDGPVNAEATITTTSGQVQVILTNLQQNPTAAGQLISGIQFTVSGATATATLASSSGKTSEISSTGAYS